MITSMTGYAARSFKVGKTEYSVEIRSYNHRFLDVSVKVPRSAGSLEAALKKEISRHIVRGKVDVHVSNGGVSPDQMIDARRMKDALQFLKKTSSTLGLAGSIGLHELFLMRDMFSGNGGHPAPDGTFVRDFLKGFAACLAEFDRSREREGRFLRADIAKRLKRLSSLIGQVETRLPLVRERQKERLIRRIGEILDKELRRERIEQEVTMLVDKTDVSEELTRFRAHVENFAKIMDGKGESGKKLDFYTQELLREVNTLSVKSQDAKVSELSVELKTEIEKIREQVQNVE